MKKQLFSLALWMFFGFVLINAIDSILRFLVYSYFHFGLWKEMRVDFLLYSIPILSVLLYLFTCIFLIKFLLKKTENFKSKNIKFPIGIYVVSTIIAIFLSPIQYKLSNLVLAKVFSKEPEPYENMEFIEIYGTMNFSLETCSWVSIIMLSIYFYRIYKKSETKAEQ